MTKKTEILKKTMTKNTNLTSEKKNLSHIKKAEICNSSTIQMRSNMFAPILKYKQSKLYKEFVKNNMILEIKIGEDTLQVRNRFLTQSHRDVLDLMIAKAKQEKYKNKDSLISRFSIYELQKSLGYKFKNDNNLMKNIIREISDANLILKDKDGREIAFHILQGYGYSKKTGEFAVLFDDNYIRYFYTKDIAVNYKAVIPDIVALESPILKALVRFVISNVFPKFNMNLSRLLEKIGISKEKIGLRQYQKIIKTVKDNKDILKEKFNIILTENDNIEYYKLENINFYNINEKQATGALQSMIEEQKKKDEEEIKESLKFYYDKLM